MATVHRDLDPEYLAAHPEHVVCVDNIEDFTTAFLFSVETQHTIGWVDALILFVLSLSTFVGMGGGPRQISVRSPSL